MVICDAVHDYIKYTVDHPGWINEDRKLLIKNIVRPLLRRNDVYFDAETYNKCIAYCENNYYQLFLYQKFIYAFVFVYKKSDDQPLFEFFFTMMGRGNGKDGLLAPLMNFLQTPLYGVKDYNIDIVANAEWQAKNTFDVVYKMLTTGGRVKPKFKGKFSVTKELIVNNVTGAELRYNTSNADTKDGKRMGCICLNEVHAYENYDQINVFESAAGKVPHWREFVITTNGYVRGGPLDEMLATAAEILRTGENPLSWFPFIARLDSRDEWDDLDAMHKANPSMEYMPILAARIEKDMLQAQKIASKKPEYMTKRCNLPESANAGDEVTSWPSILRCCYESALDENGELDEQYFEKKIPRKVPDTSGSLAVVGLDFADVRDFASCGVLTLNSPTGEYIWKQKSWICAKSPIFDEIKFPLKNYGEPEFNDFEVTQAPSIPVGEICDYIEELMSEYIVVKVIMDTYRASLFREEFENRGWTAESKNNPEGLLRVIRKLDSVTALIAPYIQQEFEAGTIIFGLSAIMRWYTNNVCIIRDKFGNIRFGKIEPKLRKTDGFMAFAAAMYGKDLLAETVIYV